MTEVCRHVGAWYGDAGAPQPRVLPRVLKGESHGPEINGPNPPAPAFCYEKGAT
jgi:hypothetical protein